MDKLIRPVVGLDPFLTIFAIFSLTEYDGDPIPTLAEYSRLGGTADFQGPIARPVSDDFRHFFHSNRHRNFTQGRGFTLCTFNALLALVD